MESIFPFSCIDIYCCLLFQPDIEPGDVIIVLQTQDHEVFTREGEDLLCSYTLSLTEALCGFQFTLKQLDGRDLLIKNPPGQVIHPGKIHRSSDTIV